MLTDPNPTAASVFVNRILPARRDTSY
jgi:hypothetical protein